MKKQLLILFAFISVLALSQVPQRFNKVIVTGDIVSPKFIKTGSNADSVLLGNGLARAISTIKTDTVSLSNRINAKAAGNGTANGTNTGDETLTSIKTKLGAATAVSDGYLKYQDWNTFNSKEPAITKNTAFNKNFGTTPGTVLEGRKFGTAAGSAVGDFQPIITGLTTNYIPKWDGSSFVNSLISDGGNSVRINSTSPALDYFSNSTSVDSRNWTILSNSQVYGDFDIRESSLINGNPIAAGFSRLYIKKGGDISIPSTTPSTSPTTGALVVDGGGGFGGKVYATGFATTSGTSSQYLMADGSVSTSTGVNQTLTTVNGSTSGSAICAMPFQTGSYKKVMIRFELMNGNITYTFPTAFSNVSRMFISASLSNSSIPDVTATYITVTGAGNSGWLFIEGY